MYECKQKETYSTPLCHISFILRGGEMQQRNGLWDSWKIKLNFSGNSWFKAVLNLLCKKTQFFYGLKTVLRKCLTLRDTKNGENYVARTYTICIVLRKYETYFCSDFRDNSVSMHRLWRRAPLFFFVFSTWGRDTPIHYINTCYCNLWFNNINADWVGRPPWFCNPFWCCLFPSLHTLRHRGALLVYRGQVEPSPVCSSKTS